MKPESDGCQKPHIFLKLIAMFGFHVKLWENKQLTAYIQTPGEEVFGPEKHTYKTASQDVFGRPGTAKRPLKHERFNIGCQATSQLTPFEMRDFRGWIPP